MKSSEFVSEGIGDWIARKGFLGYDRQLPAMMKHQADQRRQLAAISDTALEKQQRDEFLRGLSTNLKNAEDARKLQVGGSTEGMTVDQFMTEYIKKYISRLKIPAGVDFKPLIQEFASSYTGGGKLPAAASKIWSQIAMIRSLQYQGGGSAGEETAQTQGAAADTTQGTASTGGNATNQAAATAPNQMQQQAGSNTAPASTAATSAPVAAPSALKAGTEIEMPGTNIKFKYSPQWVTADGKPASSASEKVLNQLASGVSKADVPAGDLIAARRNLYQNAVGMGAYESKKRKKSNILK